MKKHIIVVMLLICSLYIMAALPPPLQAADVTLAVGDGSGFPGTTDNSITVNLDNPADKVGVFQLDICDVDNYLTCTGCEPTGHAADFECMVGDYDTTNNCCRVIMFCRESGCNIDEGSGPIAIVQYDVTINAPVGECRDLNPEGAGVGDENGFLLGVESLPGEFCFASKSEAIPTTSEWGMIIFMAIILGIGVVTLLRRRRV